jgi:hypothetical protein
LCDREPIMPFKANAARRHHVPKQKRKVTNWRAYDASLRQRGSLTIWFTDAAIAAWQAAPRTTRGGQPWYSPLAILTALTLKAVFRLALRQTEGLIGSIIRLLGLTLAVPDHSTLSRRAEKLDVPRPRSSSGVETEPVHPLVDSTGLKLCGAGEWLVEKHGTKTRRSWRKLHIGMDAHTGEIVAAALTKNDVDDASRIGPLLDRVVGPIASFTGDGAYDQDSVYRTVINRDADAAVIVPPRATAALSETARTEPTQRDQQFQTEGPRRCHRQCEPRVGGSKSAPSVNGPDDQGHPQGVVHSVGVAYWRSGSGSLTARTARATAPDRSRISGNVAWLVLDGDRQQAAGAFHDLRVHQAG